MMVIKKVLTVLVLLSLSQWAVAKENIGQGGKRAQRTNKVAESCQPATAQIDIDINNVRARLFTGGDMWWDLTGNPKYEIPKVEPGSGQIAKHSIFAGALWIGGIDAGGQLKLAAQTYRQTGNDFWPGPLDDDATVDDVVCNAFDRHWKVNRQEINDFLAFREESGTPIPLSQIPESILEWPGKGNPNAVGAKSTPLNLSPTKNLAPFVDFDGDGLYNPENGDYPDVNGDQAIWWVYNDKGDLHTETGAEAIGLEVQALAFGFGTNDEVNDMTFYQYEVLNFSTSLLDSVYFGQWVDPDLGNYQDDFVGCDTSRDLGICYNGDAIDETAVGYGEDPPIVGVDFFQGPTKYQYDAQDNIIDSSVLGMSLFLYYNNDFSNIGNPEVASHFYGYLTGTWKDGVPFTFGGNGRGGSVPFPYIFPDDPSNPNGWSECALGNTPFDRRFMQSSGPFRLDPGARNEVIVGVVWIRPESQVGCQADFDAIRVASDKAQALFDNNFDIIDGPDAPEMAIRELDGEIILSLFNDNPQANNFKETYNEVDPVIKSVVESLQDTNVTDSTYDFQGYIIYQLRNAQVSASELRDLAQARPVIQVDKRDGVSKLVNFAFDQNLGAEVPTLMVDGNDEGILHSFRITEDAFATGDRGLVNHQPYYYSVVAYAHNNFIPYEAGNDISQKEPYLEGRNNIKVYSAIPHSAKPQNGGTVVNASYGDQPQIRQITGTGNGGEVVDLDESAIADALANGAAEEPLYALNQSPVNIKIYDPIKVPDADFELEIIDTQGVASNLILRENSTRWVLRNLSTGEAVLSDTTILVDNEQLIPKWGLSVQVTQTRDPGFDRVPNNGFLEAEKIYANPQLRWLTGIQDQDGLTPFNWIRSGTFTNPANNSYDDVLGDSTESYEAILDGTFAPMALVGSYNRSIEENPRAPLRRIPGVSARLNIDDLASIDLVFTPDKSKWTRSVVLEMSDDPTLAEGGAVKLGLREHASWNKDNSYTQDTFGLSWFPGYAINIETGERLNIIFSEDSWLVGDNGADMIWNPTSRLNIGAGPSGVTWTLGGKHYIFVQNTRYDRGEALWTGLTNANTTGQVDAALRTAIAQCIWATMSHLASGFELLSPEEGIIPTETTVRLRVGKPYRGTRQGEMPLYRFSTADLAPDTEMPEIAESALDNIKVVPNPYYAYSTYEASQLDNRVRITNLPPTCSVSIYSTDGVLIRRFNRNVPADVTEGGSVGAAKTNFDSSLDWDLTNNRNVPVASGVYIIHVVAPGVGEKTVKWFGVMRPIDLDTF